MNVLEEAIMTGRLTVYTDTDPDIKAAIDNYNNRMFQYRQKKNRADKIADAFKIVTIFIAALFTTLFLRYVFLGRSMLGLVLVLSYAAIFIYSSILKNNLFIGTVASLLLVFLDFRFVILLAVDLVLSNIHWCMTASLKKEQGYPAFADVFIEYQHRPTPEDKTACEDNGEWLNAMPQSEWITPDNKNEWITPEPQNKQANLKEEEPAVSEANGGWIVPEENKKWIVPDKNDE